MSRYRARGCDASRILTVPPTSDLVATERRSDALAPARTCRSAPGVFPSAMVTLVAVTTRPRSTSKPVPACRLPNRAVVYQEVCQGVSGSPDSAWEAPCGLSPPEVPSGPNATALTGVSSVTGVAVGVAEGLAGLDGEAVRGPGRALWETAPGRWELAAPVPGVSR